MSQSGFYFPVDSTAATVPVNKPLDHSFDLDKVEVSGGSNAASYF